MAEFKFAGLRNRPANERHRSSRSLTNVDYIITYVCLKKINSQKVNNNNLQIST